MQCGPPRRRGSETSLPELSRNEEPALMAHCAPERVTAPQRAGDALSRRNGMDPDAFATSLGPKRGKNSMRARVTHRRSGLDQGSIRAPQMHSAFLGLGPMQNCDFEGLSSL